MLIRCKRPCPETSSLNYSRSKKPSAPSPAPCASYPPPTPSHRAPSQYANLFTFLIPPQSLDPAVGGRRAGGGPLPTNTRPPLIPCPYMRCSCKSSEIGHLKASPVNYDPQKKMEIKPRTALLCMCVECVYERAHVCVCTSTLITHL